MSEITGQPAQPDSAAEPPDGRHAGAPPEAEGPRAVARLIRLHNLFVFLSLGGMFVCLMIGRTFLPLAPGAVSWSAWLVALRVLLPPAALGVTAWLTAAALQRLATGAALDDARTAQTFYSCKRLSIVLLGSAALFSTLCLLVVRRNLDGLLLAFALGLLMISRPSIRGYAQFALLAQEYAPPPRSDAPDAPPPEPRR